MQLPATLAAAGNWKPVFVSTLILCIAVGAGRAPLNADPFDPRGAHVPAAAGELPPSVRPYRNSNNAPATLPPAKRPIKRAANEDASGAPSLHSSWTPLGALSLIVALILAGGMILKRHGPVANLTLPAGAVELLGKRSIDPRQSIHLVRLGNRILMLGSSPSGLRTLTEVTDPVEVDYLAGLCRQNRDEHKLANSFRALLSRTSSASRKGDPPEHTGRQSQAERELAQRLRNAQSDPHKRDYREVRDELPAA